VLAGAAECPLMALYSILLAAIFIVGAPYWLVRMAVSGRYRAGLAERLGRVPAQLRTAAATRNVIWLHAVSVGEVLAATRLVSELESALDPAWLIVISTTTATGQALARQRFAASSQDRVFYYPLDFAFSVRAWIRALRPRLVVLMESELWPRMVAECRRTGTPIAVVNARVSDRSFARGLKFRGLWSRLLVRPSLFLAQSEEDARRLLALGARPESVRISGNLKYDVRAPGQSSAAAHILALAAGRPILVAGSTHGALQQERLGEEQMLLEAWQAIRAQHPALLVLAPRHPQRFAEVESLIAKSAYLKASTFAQSTPAIPPDIVLLDTIGDLAAVYRVATVAFVGGSLVPRGGHNPLEPAQFAVPVLIGPSYENFRDIVGRLREQQGIAIVQTSAQLAPAIADLLSSPESRAELGRRGQAVFEQQQGATACTVEALLDVLRSSENRS